MVSLTHEEGSFSGAALFPRFLASNFFTRQTDAFVFCEIEEQLIQRGGRKGTDTLGSASCRFQLVTLQMHQLVRFASARQRHGTASLCPGRRKVCDGGVCRANNLFEAGASSLTPGWGWEASRGLRFGSASLICTTRENLRKLSAWPPLLGTYPVLCWYCESCIARTRRSQVRATALQWHRGGELRGSTEALPTFRGM